MLRFFLFLGLLGAARAGCAQTAQTEAPAAFPSWYVGGQFGRHDYQLAFSARSGAAFSGPGRTNARRFQLTAGYQLKPNLALQMGLAPAWQSFSHGGSGTNSAGQPVVEAGSSRGRSLAVPLLLRYTTGLKPWKKLELEALAGLVLFTARSETEFTRTENGVVTAQSRFTTTINNGFLTLGPSVRYPFGRHAAVFADWLFYRNLRPAGAAYPGGNSAGITNSVNLGVRYQFGYR